MKTFDSVIAFLASIIPPPFNTPGFGTPQILLFIGACTLIYLFWISPLLKGKD